MNKALLGCALLTGAAAGAFQPGDRQHGFTVTAVTPLPEVSGTLVEMTYDRNGARLAWLDRDDDNMTFSIAFRTIPDDDTGVAHILEHSVLCGSGKYPVKEPFVELLKSSFATFLNAWTSSDCTAYPVCSRNRTDFLNLIDVYLDAVFHPLSVQSPLAFRQEGWHYEVKDDGELTRNGVVYNEMKGAFANPERRLAHDLNRLLFPANTYRFVSGGDPAHIPELTFEKYKDFYRTHYHPSNARVFLDGKVDLPAVLARLDAVLGAYARQPAVPAPPLQPPVAAERTLPYEIGDGESPSNKTYVADAWVFAPWADREKGLAFDILTDVLADSNESPLKKALLSKGLCEDVSFGVGGAAQRTRKLVVKNVRDGRAANVRRTVRETFESLVKNGIDRTRLEAVLDRQQFNNREIDTGSFPRGLVFFWTAAEGWAYADDPKPAFSSEPLFDSLRAKLKTDWYEQALRAAVLDNPHHVAVTMVPSATLAAERAAADKAELARIKAACTPERLAEIKAQAQELEDHQRRPDPPEALAKLPALALSDIPLRGPERRVTNTVHNGVTVLSPHTQARGIVYAELHFSCAGLSPDELADLPLLARLLGELPTADRDALALRSELEGRLGRFSVDADAVAPPGNAADATAYICVRTSALDEKKDEIVRLVPEVLLRTRFTDTAAIGEHVRQSRRGKERGCAGLGARTYAVRRARAAQSAGGALDEILDGVAQIRHLQKLDDSFKETGPACAARLTALATKIFTRARLTICLADNTPAAWTVRLSAAFPAGEPPTPVPVRLFPRAREGFRATGLVSSAAAAARAVPFSGATAVGSKILSLDYLWDEIRVRGGAYGGSFRVSPSGTSAYLSWNDPKPARSLDVYAKSGDALRKFVASKAPLARYIVSTVSDTEPYLSPSAETSRAASLFLQGRTPEDLQHLRAEMLSTTPDDLLKLADALDAFNASPSTCVIGAGPGFDAATNLLDRVESIR